MQTSIGVDFGTTNSVVAVAGADGSLRALRFGPDQLDVFRSVLAFWMDEDKRGQHVRHAAGPAGLEAWLEDPLDSRLMMSLKTYLAQRSFRETRIFGRPYGLEQLIALLLRDVLADVPPATRIVVGRPVHFAGDLADDDHGAMRLRAAFAAAGFPDIEVALEPVAAGWRFARRLPRAATVLVGDFGGGTSDFSVLRFADGAGARAIGHSGIGLAGDNFDLRIIDRAVAPLLGKGDTYRVMGKDMPIPIEYYASFARWHRLSLMRAPRTMREIADVARTAQHPERLGHLLRLVQDEMGYALYRAVAGAKAALSSADSTVLEFSHADFTMQRRIERGEFETWIADDLARIGAAIDAALADAGLARRDIDHVFLTGGTSFVPAVRALFTQRFGTERIVTGGEFVSVAEGLALIGQDQLAA